MKYYKLENSTVRAIGEESDIDGDQSFLVEDSWILMSKEEVEAHINPPKTAAMILAEKVAEALAYLVKTNHKFYIGYIPKDGEDLVAIQALRDEALLFIRANDVTNP